MKTWVLLRGLMRETRHWGHFVDQLQTRFPQDQIICIEWPGNGLLHQQQSLTSIGDMAEYVQQSLIEKGIDGPYHVIAISLGAMAAIEWAHRHPHCLASCTLINTSLRRYNPIHQRLRWSQWPVLIRLALLAPAEREAMIMRLTSQRQHVPPLLAWQNYAQQYPISTANALRQLWAASHYRAPSCAPAVPLLMLNALGDQLVDPRCSAQIAAQWQVPLQTHPDAGHDLPLDDGEWVLTQIAATFFNKTEDASQNSLLSEAQIHAL
ncbi:alpha/beta fold hydrolase [Chitinibacter bivalviorum]|uniref:Alpha/beta fold hydrolase n=1 Tax=Chitinibacter bivalviorum TaxID=2739434 RepID=A0A7H9BHY6_9NEIS|nr:alpha/beta hydrolase [Chitinibacter bivalviorum]QLG88247.1 alpha/beta fold hydrolase [Chitinibacter bivalviorum]